MRLSQVGGPRVNLAQCTDLPGCQAISRVGGLALKHRWIDLAHVWPADDAVLQSIQLVASAHDVVGPELALSDREIARRVLLGRRPRPLVRKMRRDASGTRCASHDAVVVPGYCCASCMP